MVLFLLPALEPGLFIAGGQSTALAYLMIVLFDWAYVVQGHYAAILQTSLALLIIPCSMLLTLGRYTYPVTYKQQSHA
jgi:hypothetical protein